MGRFRGIKIVGSMDHGVGSTGTGALSGPNIFFGFDPYALLPWLSK